MENLIDVLAEELKSIYAGEEGALYLFPMFITHAYEEELKEALTAHLAESRKQIERLKKAALHAGLETLRGGTCTAIAAIGREFQELIKREFENQHIRDVFLVGMEQRIEHYEIASYQNAIALAEYLGFEEVSSLLTESVNEETDMDSILSELAEETLLPNCDAATVGIRTGGGCQSVKI